jgi:predicted ATPase
MSEPKDRQDCVSPKRTPDKVRLLTAEDLLSFETTPSGSGWQLPLQELQIEGLLSFGERTQFTFGRLNILVGPNGSGKSNLIDCLRVLCSAPLDIQQAFKDSGFEDWLCRGAKKQSGTATVEVTVKLPELSNRIRHEVRLGPPLRSRAQLEEAVSGTEGENGYIEQYFVGSYRSGATLWVSRTGRGRRERRLWESGYDAQQSILSQIRDVEQYPEITRLSDLYRNIRIYSEWTFGRNSNLRKPTPTSRSGAMLSESMDNFALTLNGLEKTAAHEKIRTLLHELKETYLDYVTRLEFGHIGVEIIEAPFDHLRLPAGRLSDGTLRFLALASILLHPTPAPLICLEEPELGMHPDMIRMVAEMIVDASTRTQLIVTTHSEHLLTALQDDFDALFAFDAGLAGSVVRRFSREEFEEWRQEHTLGELWTSGELGGNRW